MWMIHHENENSPRALRYTIAMDDRAASIAEVIDAWRVDAGFRTMFNSALADAPFPAFRWETPAVNARTASRPFEFILLDSPGLARHPDRDAFAAHFRKAVGDVATFRNLGGDAVLVVPTPVGESLAYGHLAAFVRQAPAAQRDALWMAVGEAMSRRVGSVPVWLSTAGAGVSWLHVRLDDRPKYYGHAAYRSSSG